MEGWTNVHTKINLNVLSLEKTSTIFGKTTLIFVKDKSSKDEGDDGYYAKTDKVVYCTLNCRQCKIISASVQGLKTTLTYSDYLGTNDKPIVPEDYKDLDAFDIRYRQKTSASERNCELVIAIPMSAFETEDSNIYDKTDTGTKVFDSKTTKRLAVEVEYEMKDYLFGLHCGHYVQNGNNSNIVNSVESKHVYTFNDPLTSGSIRGGGFGARTWLPCVDNLMNRSTYDININVAEHLIPICPGKLISKKKSKFPQNIFDTLDKNAKNNDDYQNLQSIAYRYQVDIPIPVYCLGVTIGEYEIIPDTEMPKRITTFVPKTSVEYFTDDLNDATECLSAAVQFFERTFDCPLPSHCHKLIFVKGPPSIDNFASAPYCSMTILSTDHLHPKSMNVLNNDSNRAHINIHAGNNHMENSDNGNNIVMTNRHHKNNKTINNGSRIDINGNKTAGITNDNNGNKYNKDNYSDTSSHGKKVLEMTNVDLAGEIAIGVAWNYFGTLIKVERWQDAWLPLGLSVFMSDLFIRHVFGEKEYQLRLRKRM
jgi:hypothetical protein